MDKFCIIYREYSHLRTYSSLHMLYQTLRQVLNVKGVIVSYYLQLKCACCFQGLHASLLKKISRFFSTLNTNQKSHLVQLLFSCQINHFTKKGLCTFLCYFCHSHCCSCIRENISLSFSGFYVHHLKQSVFYHTVPVSSLEIIFISFLLSLKKEINQKVTRVF